MKENKDKTAKKADSVGDLESQYIALYIVVEHDAI